MQISSDRFKTKTQNLGKCGVREFAESDLLPGLWAV